MKRLVFALLTILTLTGAIAGALVGFSDWVMAFPTGPVR
jgi:hypothetical protein